MQVQAVLWIFSTLIVGQLALADEAFKPCFDFSKKVVDTIKPLPKFDDADKLDVSSRGEEGEQKIGWAYVRGIVNRPIVEIYNVLLDHNNTKSSSVKEFNVKDIQDPNFAAKHEVEFIIKPFLFVTVKWKELWGFAIPEGSVSGPSKVVVSYQKTEGTDHIKHLCGSMVLQKVGADKTDVYLYEEAKATRTNSQNTLEGVLGTLRRLRGVKE